MCMKSENGGGMPRYADALRLFITSDVQSVAAAGHERPMHGAIRPWAASGVPCGHLLHFTVPAWNTTKTPVAR